MKNALCAYSITTSMHDHLAMRCAALRCGRRHIVADDAEDVRSFVCHARDARERNLSRGGGCGSSPRDAIDDGDADEDADADADAIDADDTNDEDARGRGCERGVRGRATRRRVRGVRGGGGVRDAVQRGCGYARSTADCVRGDDVRGAGRGVRIDSIG